MRDLVGDQVATASGVGLPAAAPEVHVLAEGDRVRAVRRRELLGVGAEVDPRAMRGVTESRHQIVGDLGRQRRAATAAHHAELRGA